MGCGSKFKTESRQAAFEISLRIEKRGVLLVRLGKGWFGGLGSGADERFVRLLLILPWYILLVCYVLLCAS